MLWVVALMGCGTGPSVASAPPLVIASPEHPTEPETPCAASPPTRASLARQGQTGILRIDPNAPEHFGECISPALVLLPDESIECEPSGLRCRVGQVRVLIAREIEEACVPIALIEYQSDAPTHEAEEILAALDMRPEACALHDLVVRGEAAFYEVERVRRVAPGRRGALGMECIRGAEAVAMAQAARSEWSNSSMECFGLRCRNLDPVTGVTRWLFAHRVMGPLRFDAMAVGEQELVLERLRERCR